MGHASLTWACSEAAVLLLRANPAGPQALRRLETTHGPGTALTVLAQQLARAVYDLGRRQTACDREQLLQREGRSARERVASLDTPGLRRKRARCPVLFGRPCTPKSAEVLCPEPCAVDETRALAPWSGHAARVALGQRGRPLSRTCASLAHAVSPRLCVGRYAGTEMFRGRREPCCVSLPASSRRRGSLHTCVGPPRTVCAGIGNEVRARSWMPTAPGPPSRKKSKQSALGGSRAIQFSFLPPFRKGGMGGF
jgi:hypothetical protein